MNPKNLDTSYKLGLDIWDCFRRKNILCRDFMTLIKIIRVYSKDVKPQ